MDNLYDQFDESNPYDQFDQPDPETPSVVVPAIKRGAGQVVSSIGSALRDVSDNALTQGIEGYGKGVVERNPATVSDVPGLLSKPGTFIKQAIGEQVPQFALNVAGAGAGALAGSAFGPIGTAIGGIAGGLLPTFAQEYGGIRAEQRDAGIDNRGRALAGAVPAAVLELLGPEAIAIKNIVKGVGKTAAKAGEGLAADGSRLAYAAKEGLKSIPTEAGTEVAQTALERYGAEQPLTGDEATRDYVLSGAGGAVAGGALGAGAAATTQRAPAPPAEPAAPAAPAPGPLTRAALAAPPIVPQTDPSQEPKAVRAQDAADQRAAKVYAERDAEEARRAAAFQQTQTYDPNIGASLPPVGGLEVGEIAPDKVQAVTLESPQEAPLPTGIDPGPAKKGDLAVGTAKPSELTPQERAVYDGQVAQREHQVTQQFEQQRQAESQRPEIRLPDGTPFKTVPGANAARKKLATPDAFEVKRLDKGQFVLARKADAENPQVAAASDRRSSGEPQGSPSDSPLDVRAGEQPESGRADADRPVAGAGADSPVRIRQPEPVPALTEKGGTIAPDQNEDRSAPSIEQNESVTRYRGLAQARENNPDYFSADLAKELFPEYAASNDTRRDNDKVVQKRAARVRDEAFEARLQEPAQPNERVTFLAGGPGSGKTSGRPETGIVYDSTLANPEAAVDKVRRVLASGRDVEVNYTVTQPVIALKRAINRQKDIGRPVTLADHTATHRGANETVRHLAEVFRGDDRVSIRARDNSGDSPVPLNHVPEFDYNGLDGKLRETLDAEYAAGNIDERAYQAFVGAQQDGQAGESLAGAGGARARGLAADAGPAQASGLLTSPNADQRSAAPVAESQAPGIDPGDGGVANALGGVAPQPIRRPDGAPFPTPMAAGKARKALPDADQYEVAKVADRQFELRRKAAVTAALVAENAPTAGTVRPSPPQTIYRTPEGGRFQRLADVRKAIVDAGYSMNEYRIEGSVSAGGMYAARKTAAVPTSMEAAPQDNANPANLQATQAAPVAQGQAQETQAEPVKTGVPRGTTGASSAELLPVSVTAPAPIVAKGAPRKVVTAKGREVDTAFDVVDAGDLVVSNDEQGRANPAYPAYLQPRDRSSATSQAQVARIAGALRPELLADSGKASDGAPIVGDDNVVESGNGRIAAIRSAYGQNQAQGYRDYIRQNAAQFGLTPEQVDGLKNPVLVRRRTTRLAEAERAEFARQANQADIAALSPREQARSDAQRITDEDISAFRPDESGNVLARSNDDFLKTFAQRIGANEAGGLTTADGRYTKQLADRVQAAVFAKAYDDERLTQLFAEEADPDIKNVLTALSQAAPSFAKARSVTGSLGDLDVVSPLIEAIETVRSARRSGTRIDEALAQTDAFTQRNPEADKLVRVLDQHKRSPRRIGDMLTWIAQAVEAAQLGSRTQALFADAPKVSREQLIDAAIERLRSQDAKPQQQTSLGLGPGFRTQGDAQREANQPAESGQAPAVRDRAGEQAESGRAAAGDAGVAPAQVAQDKPAPKSDIQDFGEKLGGARKDQAPSLSKELTDSDIATQPLAKVWPADEIDGMEDSFAAAFAFALREEIPAKPRVDYKLKRWVETVKGLRDVAQRIAKGEITRQNYETKIRLYPTLANFKNKVDLLEGVDRSSWKRVGAVNIYPNAYRFEGAAKIPSPFSQVEIDGKRHRFDAVTEAPTLIQRVKPLLGEDAAGKKMAFEVRGRADSWSINKKGDKEYRKLKTFTTSKEALDYVRSHYDDVVAAWDGVKDRDNVRKEDVRRADNRPRTGSDYRSGKDVTEQEFTEAFGFRGVEFGNWLKQGEGTKERQGMLNQVYDALMDLSNIVGVPPQALSLNGSLGLGLGSRGHGSASAHFEPNTLVINLTKTRGAGSLAHEWFHALDNYFSRMRGGEKPFRGDQNAYRRENYITYRPEPLLVHKTARIAPMTKADIARQHAQNPKSDYWKPENWQPDPKHPEGVRPEVERAFADLVEALNASPMTARAQANDKAEDGYWSRIIERGARSFENYVISKMMEKGYENDYLANVRQVEDFPRSRDRYPYLLPQELAPIAEAFDTLFKTIETREEGGNVVMFSLGDATGTGLDVQSVRATLDKAFGSKGIQNLIDAGILRIVPDVRGLPPGIRDHALAAGARVKGLYDRDNRVAYMVAGNLKANEVVSNLLHEVGEHYGLKTMLGDEGYARLIEQTRRLSKFNPTVKAAYEHVKRLYQQRNESEERFWSEVIAWTAEQPGILKQSWFKNLIQAVRRFLFQTGLVPLRLTDQDIAGMVAGSLRNAFSTTAEPVPQALVEQPSFSLATRAIGVPASAGLPITSFTDTAKLKTHPDYKAAKAGDREAAARLVQDLVSEQQIEEARNRFGTDAIYLPAHGIEATGHNAIPEALAHYYAARAGGTVADDIIQSNEPHHTGADQMERLVARPLFDGPVQREGRYVLVDDVSTMGATLAELADHILAGGGRVVGSALLANASRSGRLVGPKMFTNLVERRFGDEVRSQFNIEPASLTHDEAQYLAGFKDADQLRTRAAKARVEAEKRLLSKGVRQDVAGEGSADFALADAQTAAGSRASWDAPEPSKLDDLIYSLQDKQIDLRRVVQAVQKAGGKLKDDIDPYLQEELYRGRAAKNTQDFIDGELKPLLTDIASKSLTLDEVQEYLHARHAEEANVAIARRNPEIQDGGSGLKTADARAYLSSLPAPKRAQLDGVAKRVDAIISETRKTLVGYGLESQDTVNTWANAYRHYIPLQREDMDGGPGIGQGFSVRGPATKMRTGSTRKVVDILANVALQRERAIVRGEKNKVANALIGLAEANPNAEFWKVDRPPTLKTVNERTGLVETRIDPLYKSRENVVVARVPTTDGIKERSVIFDETDPRALRMAAAIKNLDMDHLGSVLSVSARVTRYLASVNTQFNPVFGIVNLVRDAQNAVFNLSTTPIAGKKAEVTAHLLSALSGVYSDARKVRAGGQALSPWAQEWEEFQKVGGQTGYRDMFRTSKDRADAIETELKRAAKGDPLRAPRAIFDWLSDYNLAMENAVRLAAYKTAKDSGISKERAASIAKNLTVNFNRKGQVAQQAGALYAFFNASAQGTARLLETLAGPAGRKIVTGGLVLGTVQALALAAAGFDDDEPPEFVRERNLLIPIGDKKYLTIPMPLGLHVIPSTSRIITELALSGFDNAPKRAIDLIGLFADAFNPIGNAGLSLQTIAPTVIDPLAALSENKDFAGRAIYREDFSNLNPTPGFTRAKDTATLVGTGISKALNYLTGGSEYTPGALSPSPDAIDYLLEQATGGVGREYSKGEQTVSSAFSGEELPPYKVPLLGRFFGDANGQAGESAAFYSNLRRINGHEAEIKGRVADRKSPAEYIREHPDARLVMFANRVEREVSELRKRKREALKNDAPKALVQRYDAQITIKMQLLNERARALREAA